MLNRAIYKERNTVTSFLDVQINVSSVFQYFLIYLMLLIPGSCLFAKYFLGDWKYYVLLVFYAALFVSGKKYREGYAPVFALLLLVFVVVTRLITDGGAGLSAWMQFAVCLASVHFAVCCNRRMFLTRFVKLVCVFSVISLVFWLLFLVFPQLADIYPAQTYFTQSIGSDPAWAKDYYGKGLFLYSYLEIHPTRNCGIYTEPGVHQIVLNSALFVMLFWGHKLTGLTGRKYFWRLAVLVFTVLSCQSTAGYIGFLLIVVFFMFSRRVRSKGRYAAKAKRALATATTLISQFPDGVKNLFCVLFDISDGVANSGDQLSLIVGNGDAELLLELHDKLHGVQRVGAQIVSETCLRLYFSLVNTKLVHDDLLNFCFNF